MYAVVTYSNMRGSMNYHLAGVLDTIDALYQKYNTFLDGHEYSSKYGIGNVQILQEIPIL